MLLLLGPRRLASPPRGPLMRACALMAVILTASLCPGPRAAELWAESGRLQPIAGSLGDTFGTDVALEHDTALVGARWEGSSGAAYLFSRTPRGWAQQARLDPAGLDAVQFGVSVALSGETALVGGNLSGVGGVRSGAAYVFVQRRGIWSLQGVLLADDRDDWDNFGVSVALDGDTAVVGAPGKDHQGAAYVFRYDGVAWSQQAKLLPAPSGPGMQFGRRVAIENDTVLVGAPDSKTAGFGSVFVYVRDDGRWSQQAELLPDDHAVGDYFGFALSLSDGIAVVGAPFRDGAEEKQGAAYVFTQDSGVWRQQAKLVASDAARYAGLGESVSTGGGRIVVGASNVGGWLDTTGAAYLYESSSAGWAERAKLAPIGGRLIRHFGGAVATDGSGILVGADFEDRERGAVYWFDASGPPGPVELLRDLERRISLSDRENRTTGFAPSRRGLESVLLNKLDDAVDSLEDPTGGDPGRARDIMETFMRLVEAHRGQSIAEGDADLMLLVAGRILDLLD